MPNHRVLTLSVVALTGLLVTAPPVEAGEGRDRFGLFKKLRWASADGENVFRVNGQFVLDSAAYTGAEVGDDEDLGDGTELRRNRISASAKFLGDWRANASWELAGDRPEWRNAWIGYDGFRRTRLRLGQQRAAFGLGQGSFMEGALPTVLVPGYGVGASASSYGKRWSLSGGVFDGTLAAGRDQGWSAGARVTFTPVLGRNGLLHIGFATNFREPEDGIIRYRSRPESHVTDERLVNTGRIRGVEKRLLHGVELAWVRGRYSFQGEYMEARLGRDLGSENLNFSGWYAHGSWVVTGETLRYRRSSGSFRSIEPASKHAVEVALRYSELDLDDGPITGGQGQIWTLGVNWYYTRYLRVMANYSTVHGSELSFEDDPRALQLRLAVRVAS